MSQAPDSCVVACHECDHLHSSKALGKGEKAHCSHCGNLLYRSEINSVDNALALYLASAILLVIANTSPFMSLKITGRLEENMLASGAWRLYELGMGELGLLVFATSSLFPAVIIGIMLYLLSAHKLGYQAPGKGYLYRLVGGLMPWSLISVFILGVLIAITKLMSMGSLRPGPAFFALFGVMATFTAAKMQFEPKALWPHISAHKLTKQPPGITAAQRRLYNCHNCALLVPQQSGPAHCPRCNSPLHMRKTNSLARTKALIITASVLLIPANIYPIMTVIQLGSGQPDTIVSGVIHLIEAGMWPLALLVFFASVFVPVLKLIVLTALQFTVSQRSQWRRKDRTLMYRVTEVVGAWSMVDIFLLALLAALVNLNALASIEPGIGAIFFAAAVISTILAAQSFDPRLMWDTSDHHHA